MKISVSVTEHLSTVCRFLQIVATVAELKKLFYFSFTRVLSL